MRSLFYTILFLPLTILSYAKNCSERPLDGKIKKFQARMLKMEREVNCFINEVNIQKYNDCLKKWLTFANDVDGVSSSFLATAQAWIYNLEERIAYVEEWVNDADDEQSYNEDMEYS